MLDYIREHVNRVPGGRVLTLLHLHMRTGSLLTLFLILFVKIIKCSESSESGSSESDYEIAAPKIENLGKVHSSDEEESVNGDRDKNLNDLRQVFDNFGIDDYRRRRIFSELFYKKPKNKTQSVGSSKPLMCLDGEGNEVDWWIVYKEPKGLRYLYYSSNTQDRKEFIPLDSNLLINDPVSSPVLQTIYHPKNNRDASEVWLGWNDQPSDRQDAFKKNVCGIKHAHSKGFYAQNASVSDDKSEATIGAYAILTSLPKFPMTEESIGPINYGAANKHRLPVDPREIFDSNLSENAQHFMCLSFPRQRVVLEQVESVLEVPVQWDAPHVNFLTKYLKTIHAAIVGTNFVDQNVNHFIWRRYFSLLNRPYPSALGYFNAGANEKLLVYSKNDLPSLDSAYNTPASHVFPLTGSIFYREADSKIYFMTGGEMVWRWEARFSGQNGCYEGEEDSCLASFNFTTTSLQSALTLQLFAKHGRFIMDLFDDWAALQLTQTQKWLRGHYTGQTVDRFGLLVQSWTDSKTILPRRPSKKIYDPQNGKVVATVHVDNVEDFWMPVNAGDPPVRVETCHRDHSKWAIGFALDSFNNDFSDDEGLKWQQYEFKPLFFLSDLNRATTQVQLKDKPQGRGGGIIAIGNLRVWQIMMAILPRSQTSRCSNKTKEKARNLQATLQRHLASSQLSTEVLPLRSLRPSLFKSLRLSKSESVNQTRAAPFLPFLNELSEYFKHVEFESEHSALFALNRLFHLIAEGRMTNAAKTAWLETKEQILARDQSEVTTVTLPKFVTLPRLNLYRDIPKQNSSSIREMTPHIVANEVGQFITMDSIQCAFEQYDRLERKLNSKQTVNEQYDQEEFERYVHEPESRSSRNYGTECEEIIEEQYIQENGDYLDG